MLAEEWQGTDISNTGPFLRTFVGPPSHNNSIQMRMVTTGGAIRESFTQPYRPNQRGITLFPRKRNSGSKNVRLHVDASFVLVHRFSVSLPHVFQSLSRRQSHCEANPLKSSSICCVWYMELAIIAGVNAKLYIAAPPLFFSQTPPIRRHLKFRGLAGVWI
jgi:hypothetical protein